MYASSLKLVHCYLNPVTRDGTDACLSGVFPDWDFQGHSRYRRV